MRARVLLSVACSGAGPAGDLTRVLTPDNAGLPKGLAVVLRTRKRAVEFEVTSQSPSTALSTVMAILRDVSLFEQVWLLSRAPGA